MKTPIIAPSILALDFSQVSLQLNDLNDSAAEWLHFDVMDGHFVPNITFGPDILRGFKKAVDKIMDVHIMVSDPMYYAPVFIKAGADIVTFHIEAFEQIEQCIECAKMIRSHHALAGISVKPNSGVETILPFLKYFDLVLVMSVEPGFGGQSFQPKTLDKVARLRKEIDENHLEVKIEIDGGIDLDTALLAMKAGCDVLVAGSFIFKHNINEAIKQLKNIKY